MRLGSEMLRGGTIRRIGAVVMLLHSSLRGAQRDVRGLDFLGPRGGGRASGPGLGGRRPRDMRVDDSGDEDGNLNGICAGCRVGILN